MALRDVKTCHRHHDHHDNHLHCRHLRRLQSKSLNAHHAAMTSMHTQLASVQAAFATKRRQFACLRDVLDEATEQLTMETYRRRREITQRLSVDSLMSVSCAGDRMTCYCSFTCIYTFITINT